MADTGEAFGDAARKQQLKRAQAARFRSRRYSATLDQLKTDHARSRAKSSLLRRLTSNAASDDDNDDNDNNDDNDDNDEGNDNVNNQTILQISRRTKLHKLTVLDCTAIPRTLLPRRLVRCVSTGVSITLLCTVDGGCYQFGTLGAIQSPPQQVSQLEGKIVVHVAVGIGTASHEPPPPAKMTQHGEGEDMAGGGYHGFDNEDHMCVLTNEDENNLWTWGGNDHGQLGRGTKGNFGWRPEAISFGADHHEHISYVAAGLKYTVAITECNHVWSFGINHRGQLGIGTFRTTVNKANSTGQSIFLNTTGDHDITAPMTLKQLDRGYVKEGDTKKMDNPFGPFGEAVFHEEQIDSSIGSAAKNQLGLKYQRRQRMVACGVNHSMVWSSLNDLPKNTSNILYERDQDRCDLDTTIAMLEDRAMELSMLRSPDDMDDDDDDDDKDGNHNGSDKESEDEEEGKRIHSVGEAKAERRRQRLRRPVDPAVRVKKIVMMLVGGASEDGTPADALTLRAVNDDPLINAAIQTLSALEESIQTSKYNIDTIRSMQHRATKEVESIEARVTDAHTNVSILQDFVEDVPRIAPTNNPKMKLIVSAVADDSSQLVRSDRIILNHTEEDQDRLYQQVVLQNRQLTAKHHVLARLTNEYKSLAQVATSRAKIVMRRGINQGVDAFDAAKMLSEVSDRLNSVEPSKLLQRAWQRRTDEGTKQQLETGGTVTSSLYDPTVAKAARISAHLMNELLSEINNAHFVHEFGAPKADHSLQKLKDALASISTAGHSVHAVERVDKKVGGTSAAHELLKFGAKILADTLSINDEIEKICHSLVVSSK